MKRVLCILENGFEEIEAIAPVDLLRRAGIEVVMAGVSARDVTGKCGVRVTADAILRALRLSCYAEGFGLRQPAAAFGHAACCEPDGIGR